VGKSRFLKSFFGGIFTNQGIKRKKIKVDSTLFGCEELSADLSFFVSLHLGTPIAYLFQ